MRSRMDIVKKALESFPGVKVMKMSGSINRLEKITVLVDPTNIPQRLFDAASASRGSYTVSHAVQPIHVAGNFEAIEVVHTGSPHVEIELKINPGFYKILGEEVDRQVFKEMDTEADTFIEQWLGEND